MKQPTFIMKLLTAVLLVGVLVYFGTYLVRSYRDGLTIVLAYEDSVTHGFQATGVLVREETVLTVSSSAPFAELIPAEGEKVAAGDPVAILYASSGGLDSQKQISALEAEIEQLEYVLNSSGSAGDAAKLDAEVLDAIARLRSTAATGDLSDLENDALSLRTLVFKRDYAYGDTGAADAVSALIAEKKGELSNLRTALGSASTTIYASQPGVFSGLTDGYESVLTPAVLNWAAPSQLLELQSRPGAVTNDQLGKLITSATWYFAAAVPQEDAGGLEEGRSYAVLFSNDWTGTPEMTLERVSEPEDGRVVLVFSCRTHLSDTTLLRSQTVEVVTGTVSGLRIPSQALRAITETVTDKETGETTENTILGVYVAVGAEAEFKRVNVLWRDEDSFLVEAYVDPTAPATDRADAKRLRAGDEIILSTSGLYDGKVIR